MKNPDQPAVLGGEAVFGPALPMASPRLPDPDKLLPKFREILETGQLTKGRALETFENSAAEYLGVKHCIGVSSCTSGLMLCLQQLKRKIKPTQSHKIAVPSFTFMASITALIWAGLEPVFVEVEPESMNICLDDLRTVLSSEKLAGILPVHCFGNPIATTEIESLSNEFGTSLIFDAAHGFGSTHQEKKLGNGGWAEVFSLTPTKIIVAGEGGLIATQDPDLAKALKTGREYGNDGNYDTVFPGINARLSELHATLACGSLAMVEEIVAERNRSAQSMMKALEDIPGLSFQKITPESRTTYKDFTLQVDPERFGLSRDQLAQALLLEGIPSRKYFSPPCHRHQAFQSFSNRPLPQTDRVAQRCLSLPLLNRDDSSEGIGRAFRKLHENSQKIQTALCSS